MAWLRAEALIGLARRHLFDGHVAEAAGPLRVAHKLCQEMEAQPLLDDIAALARSRRISLAEPEPSTNGDRPTAASPLDQLTARESEILRHLVAGRTYREIAEQLFITEKTVSAHVSNLLRKTGTRNRVEVAELARQLSED
jgi:DNA-binding NarL/FixJ family response regulator